MLPRRKREKKGTKTNVRVQGADRYYENIKDMIGYRPSLYMKYCWKLITPAVSTVSKPFVFTYSRFISILFFLKFKYAANKIIFYEVHLMPI